MILTGGFATSQNVLARIHKDTIGNVIGESHNVIDNLLIMRFYLSFYIPLMG